MILNMREGSQVRGGSSIGPEELEEVQGFPRTQVGYCTDIYTLMWHYIFIGQCRFKHFDQEIGPVHFHAECF